MRTTTTVLLTSAILLTSGAARAQAHQASLDHAGSVGAIVAVSGEYSTTEKAECLTCGTTEAFDEISPVLDLGGTLALGSEGDELVGFLRLVRFTKASGESLFLGYRRYFGYEEWKSFFELDLMGTLRPVRTIGARAGIGAMYELSPIFGLWGSAGASFGLGGGRRFGVELGVGLQARSYLLE